LIPNPILKVLSTISSHEVRHLLMGGQACVFYGAAEFSRDCDIVIVADPDNLLRLNEALSELGAECIALPPYDPKFWERGHAIHFRCRHPDCSGIRLDIMTTMRGCDPFAQLWERRTSVADEDGTIYELLGIEDLVKAKKTQRDKDWPMIQRLVDAHYDEYHRSPTEDQVRFWLRESRTAETLIATASAYPDLCNQIATTRPLLTIAAKGTSDDIKQMLRDEEAAERVADEQYWQPLKAELQALRSQRGAK
jgi:hypothetical protein